MTEPVQNALPVTRSELIELIERKTRRGRNGAYITDIEVFADLIMARLPPVGGWGYMPEEPTAAMIRAADRTGCLDAALNGTVADAVRTIYRAMRSPAPPAPPREDPNV